MDFIFGILLGTRLLGGIAGGLDGSPPARFSQPQIVLSAQEIRLDCAIENAIPPRLRKLAENSVPVTIYLFVQTRDETDDQTVSETIREKMLISDIIGKNYCVIDRQRSDTLRFSTLDSAITSVSAFAGIRACTSDTLTPGNSYSFTVYAVLGTAMVEALQNKRIDLMYYWDYKRPTFKTEPFDANQLIIPRK